MRPQTRHLLIATAALVVGGLAWQAPPKPDAALEPAPRPTGERRTESAPRYAALPEREGIGAPQGRPFAPRSWAPPAPPPVVQAAAPPAPPPAAPALPFKFAGKLVQDGVTQVLISKGDTLFVAKVGEPVDGGFKVESIQADRINFVYEPLGTKSSLRFDSALDVATAPGTVTGAPTDAKPLPQARDTSLPQEATSQRLAQLRWDGPASVRAGDSFNLVLRVTSGQPLRASPMLLRFDAGVLEAVRVQPGKFYAAGAGNFGYRVNPDGSIYVGMAGKGASAANDAELLVLTFKLVKPGTSAEINLASLNLQTASGSAIGYEQLAAFRASALP